MAPNEHLVLQQLLTEIVRLRKAVSDLKEQVPPVSEGERSYSIEELCAAEGISRAFLNKLRSAGRGPREMRLSGDCIRFSPEARREWHERLEAESSGGPQ